MSHLSYLIEINQHQHIHHPYFFAILGSALSAMLNVVFALAEGFGPWWYVLTAVPFSLTGGYTALFTGAFTYISDITTNENRSLRYAHGDLRLLALYGCG